MANEKRLIDANALLDLLRPLEGVSVIIKKVLAIIRNCHTVDAVEVVRCRNCKYFSRDAEYNRAWCNFYTGCIETAVNGYCYHGAKMDGGNEDG